MASPVVGDADGDGLDAGPGDAPPDGGGDAPGDGLGSAACSGGRQREDQDKAHQRGART